MSGILGLLRLVGDEIQRRDLAPMAAFLEQRGPEGTHLWSHGPAGLGHTRLSTTPEAVKEFLPLLHQPSGCVITADLRLDNRGELLSALGLRVTDPDTGDAGLVLHAYLRWGIRCVERLLGDFAFAIWDPRRHQLFCARDHFGLKPFNYHHGPGRLFAFASSALAVAAEKEVPTTINQARLADALLPDLEGIDTTSTFFEDVFRLPPAHALVVSPDGLRIWRYWTLDPDVELYAGRAESIEALLDAFTKAVDARLRTVGPPASMLSGGMDSNSVVAIAKELLAAEGKLPLMTISAISNDPTCVESNAIRSVMAQGGIDAHTVAVEELDDLMPAILGLTAAQEEPFDQHMTIIRAIYLAARALGAVVVLDGGAGDVVLTEGAAVERLLRRGQLRTAVSISRGRERFWSTPGYGRGLLLSAGARAFVPHAVRGAARRVGIRRSAEREVRESLVDPDFALRVDLAQRLVTYRATWPTPEELGTSAAQRAVNVTQPYLVAARERYDRTAASLGLEPRDPFLDRRVVEAALRIPDGVMDEGGWPKAVLRHAMAGRVPNAVRWRTGKEHLGWSFTQRRLAPDNNVPSDRSGDWSSLLQHVVREDRLTALANITGTADLSLEDRDAIESISMWLHMLANNSVADI